MRTVNRIGLFRGDGFQDFCSVLLSAHVKDFQAVDGRGGDLGNDGFTVRGDTLFQAFAPDTRTFVKVRDKINDSVAKVISLRTSGFPSVNRLVFLTPFDLTVEQHAHLRATVTDAGLESESWGEAKLLAILSEHPGIKAEFPEILLPDLLDEIRKLQVANVPPQQPPASDDYAAFSGELPWIDVLQKNEAGRQHDTCAAYSYFKLHVVSQGLALPSIEPDDEDAFLSAVRERFWEDGKAELETRNHVRVVVQRGLPELTYHRRWGRWTMGMVTMAATLPDLERPGSYSVADMAIDVTRALRLAAFVGRTGPARVRFAYDPNQLEVRFDPSDPRVREGGAKLEGVHLVERPALTQTYRESAWEGDFDMSDLAADAHLVAADLIVPAVRYFHLARIDTRTFAASIPKLISARLDEASA